LLERYGSLDAIARASAEDLAEFFEHEKIGHGSGMNSPVKVATTALENIQRQINDYDQMESEIAAGEYRDPASLRSALDGLRGHYKESHQFYPIPKQDTMPQAPKTKKPTWEPDPYF